VALTKRQKQVLDLIANFVDDNGYCPSYDEIARGLNLASLATVHKHISALEAKNYLKRGFNQSRSLELAPRYLQEQRRRRPGAVTEIPLLGRIAAGTPVEAIENPGTLNFADFAGSGDTFALEVRGNSMIDDHICDGDLIQDGETRLRALHTPGHASNHACLLLEASGLLFTGDHLMSGSTVVILPPDGSMRLYVESLRRLREMPIADLAPGHGALIQGAHAEIDRVLAHRLLRESKVVAAFESRGATTLEEVLPVVYADVPRFMHPVAKFSLLAHAIKLEEEGRAVRDGELWSWRG